MKTCLLTYCKYPDTPTTAWYLERSLRKMYNVITVGENLENNTGPAKNPYDSAIPDLISTHKPDFVLGVESGGFEVQWTPSNKQNIPHFWWAIDTHISLHHHMNFGAVYDGVFLAQAAYIGHIKQRNPNCWWLPLACDPEIHYQAGFTPERVEGVVFVGNMHPACHQRRIRLVEELKAAGLVVKVLGVWGTEMAKAHQSAELVLNCSLNGDINMRWFEGMCSGRPFLTDVLPVESHYWDLCMEGMYLPYETSKDVLEWVNRYNTDEIFKEGANRMGLVAGDRVRRLHSYDARVKRIAQIVDNFSK